MKNPADYPIDLAAQPLAGQVALVTGGGRGIGRTAAQFLAEAGATVAVTSRTAAELDQTVALIEDAGGRAMAWPADVTDAVAVHELVADIEKSLGPIDLLVNNAGVIEPFGPAWEVEVSAWWRCQEINLLGPFVCAHAVLPGMIRRGKGRIINVASNAGLQPGPTRSAYAVSKAALIRLSENLAVETADYGISVFAISPGFVHTRMVETSLAQHGSEGVRQAIAAGNDVPPELSAGLIRYLATGAADALSGHYIHVDDDVLAMVRHHEEITRNNLYTLRMQKLPTT